MMSSPNPAEANATQPGSDAQSLGRGIHLESVSNRDQIFDQDADVTVDQRQRTKLSIERITQIVNDLPINPQTLKAAPRNLQYTLAGSVTGLISSFFEWWSGFARVHGIVNYSATGDGNAFSDWRGLCVFALCLAVAALASWQLLHGGSAPLRKASAIMAASALGFALWFWAAFSAAAGFSDGLSLELGASFGLYLGIAAATLAVVGAARDLRGSGTDLDENPIHRSGQ